MEEQRLREVIVTLAEAGFSWGFLISGSDQDWEVTAYRGSYGK
jgi:hypothetical protein